jgi:osmoprotectant transport system ATP-binding protein
MILKLEEACKSLAGKVIVGPISLDFATAATTVLLGPSGAGKSTILRLFAGLERADSGKVWVDEIELDDASIHGIRRKIGYAVTGAALFPHLSAHENVTLRLQRAHINQAMIDRRMKELAGLFRISTSGFNRYPHQLTPWQKLRVAIVRALMPDPQILLFDDVLGDLDRPSRTKAMQLLPDIFRQLNKTIVWVTHDLNEALNLADHAALLLDGRVAQRGHLMDLIDNPVDQKVSDFMRADRLWLH